jgi:hypothetical protein
LVDENVAELKDCDRRKNNVIFFTVPESSNPDPHTRMQDDLDAVNKIVSEQMHVFVNLSNPIRFGPRPSGDAKPRLLHFSFGSEDEKWKILKASKTFVQTQQESQLSVFVRIRARIRGCTLTAFESEMRTCRKRRGPLKIDNSKGKNCQCMVKDEVCINQLLCIYTNSHSFVNKCDEMLVHIKTSNPDIIGITEVLPKNSKFEYTVQDLQYEGLSNGSRISCLYQVIYRSN